MKPKFYSDVSSFQVTLYNFNYGADEKVAFEDENVAIAPENVAIDVAIERLNADKKSNSGLYKYGH